MRATLTTSVMNEVPPPAPKRRSCLVPILISLIAVLLIIIGVYWWHNRPIKPVQLSVQEKAAVEMKLEAVQKTSAQPSYEKGAKEIILTERELNGLLNENTTLGDKLKFELVEGAVHARIETDLDKDLPIVGGKRLKAQARFFVNTDSGHPKLVLDDLTVWGISLPNDWLGGLKGQDLLGQTVGTKGAGLAGVKEMKVESGRLVIRLED
jgi:hypothetical protein